MSLLLLPIFTRAVSLGLCVHSHVRLDGADAWSIGVTEHVRRDRRLLIEY